MKEISFDRKRFEKYFDCPGEDCWEWKGSKLKGYGIFWGKVNGKPASLRAHRISYSLYRGEIKYGLEIDHLCGNPSCVNTSHLEPVTHIENLLRGNGNHKKKFCPRGHPLDSSNIIPSRFRRTGHRSCLICHNRQTIETQRRRATRKKFQLIWRGNE